MKAGESLTGGDGVKISGSGGIRRDVVMEIVVEIMVRLIVPSSKSA